MRKLPPSQRTPEDVTDCLRDEIVAGTLEPGAKILEVELSERLGVSRTPLREALRSLEREGFVRAEHNRGFWVAPLNADEVRELYPVLWALEGLAIKDGAAFLRACEPELRRINAAFKAHAHSGTQATHYDALFHNELTRFSANIRLQRMLRSLKVLISRYETVYMQDSALIGLSHAQHDRIIEGITEGDIDATVLAVEDNWRFGMEALLRKL